MTFGLVGGLVGGLAVVLVGVLSDVLVAELAGGLIVGLAVGGTVGLTVGLAVGLTGGPRVLGPALQLAVAEAIWGLRLKRVRFMTLPQTALDKQVLRQAGTVYQFRHAALQDLLAAHDITTPAAEPRLTSRHTTRL